MIQRNSSIIFVTIFVLAFLFEVETRSCVDEEESSTVWYVINNTSLCHDLRRWLQCEPLTQKLYLVRGICLTFDDDTGGIAVGKCPYTVFQRAHKSVQQSGFIELPSNLSELNDHMCGLWNREGYLCSQCKSGYGLTIPNIFMNCVECKFNNGQGWVFYFMLELIPVVILFVTLSVFRISVVKPPLNAYVAFCQASLAILFVHSYRFLSPFVIDNPALVQAHHLSMMSLGVWSMSFTEFIHGVQFTDFCVDSSINIQQMFILTQIKSLFPLLLIFITYVCIKLHTLNCKVIVWLWKPFSRVFTHWNTKLSLVDVFSSFLLLSYSRFIIVSYFIFSFQDTHHAASGSETRLLYNPVVNYFNPSHHLPYAFVFLFTLFTVALPPVFFLAFYQTRCFQRLLSCLRLQRSLSIYIFVDLFQSCYKNGLNGSYDLRFTSSLYLILRIAVLVTYVGCNCTTFATCNTMFMFFWVFLLLLFFSLVRPYKDQRMNVLDSLMMAGLALVNLLLSSTSQNTENKTLNLIVLIFVLIIIAIPQAVFFSYLFYKLCCRLVKLQCVKRYFERVKRNRISSIISSVTTEQSELCESLADRIDNPYSYCHDVNDF